MKVPKIPSLKISKEILLSIVFFATRIFYLGWDIINVDAPAWNYRATQFYSYLKTYNFLETYRSYHPGVTLMWLSGFGIEVFNQIYKILNGVRAPYYDYQIFPWLHFSQKFPLVISDLVLLLIIYKLLKNLSGVKFSFLFVLFLILEPFFVANTRVLHLDGLMTLFMLVSILYTLIYLITSSSLKYLILAGVFSALAVLTKVSAVIVLPFNILLLFILGLTKKGNVTTNIKKIIVHSLTLSIVFILTTFFIFPSMWVAPFETVYKIIFDGVIGTGGGGQGQVFLGKGTQDPGVLFYIYTLGFRVSPILLVLLPPAIILIIKKLALNPKKFVSKNAVLLTLIGFGVLFFVQMTFATKKIDRYILPVIPALVFLAVWFLNNITHKIKLGFVSVLLILQFLLLSYPIYPEYFNYANPILGGLSQSLKVFGSMDWGAGYYEAANFLNNQPETSSNSWLAAYNDQSIDPYFKGRVEQIDRADFSKMQYVILPSGDSYKSEVLNYGFAQIYSVKYGDVDYWYIYENNNPIKY